MVCWKEWSNSRCPRCRHFGKDSNHFITCKDKTAYDTFTNAVIDLQDKLQRIKTHPNIINTIVLGLLGGPDKFFCDIVDLDPEYEYDVLCRTIAVAALEKIKLDG